MVMPVIAAYSFVYILISDLILEAVAVESCEKIFLMKEGSKNFRVGVLKQAIQAYISVRISKSNANKFNDYVLCIMF